MGDIKGGEKGFGAEKSKDAHRTSELVGLCTHSSYCLSLLGVPIRWTLFTL